MPNQRSVSDNYVPKWQSAPQLFLVFEISRSFKYHFDYADNVYI